MNFLTTTTAAVFLASNALLSASPYVTPPTTAPDPEAPPPTPLIPGLLPPIDQPTSDASIFFGYEFGEMVLNDFQNFAGEMGYAFASNRAIRLTYMNVALTERHLSQSTTLAVDGDNVAGLWRGAELFIDLPVTKNIYLSPSIGYYDSKFYHTQLAESVRTESPTAGLAFSYLGDNVLGSTDFYWRFSLSYRYYFEASEETMLGETTINEGTWDVIPWIFVGYRFNLK